jgi:hypothetical protein
VRELKGLQNVLDSIQFSQDEPSIINSIQLENGDYTTTEKGTMEERFRVHFPGSEVILEPSGGWNGLELVFSKGKGSRADWLVPKWVITYHELKWTVFSFLLLNLLCRLTPVLPGVRTRRLCSDPLSSVFSVCLGCVFLVVDYP